MLLPVPVLCMRIAVADSHILGIVKAAAFTTKPGFLLDQLRGRTQTPAHQNCDKRFN